MCACNESTGGMISVRSQQIVAQSLQAVQPQLVRQIVPVVGSPSAPITMAFKIQPQLVPVKQVRVGS